MREAIAAMIQETAATSPKDMGKVMGALKERFTGRLDFGAASALVKQLLSR